MSKWTQLNTMSRQIESGRLFVLDLMALASPVRSFILWAALLGLSGHTALAQQDAAAVQNLPSDVRVLIDVSGSMKQNDPANLRQPAVELLLQLLPEGSKAGIWTFGRYINMLVPHREVTEAWKKDAIAKAQDINSVGLYSNIGEALEKAAYDFDRPSDKFQTSVILLTDGMVDIDKDPQKNQDEWRRIVDEVLPKLKSSGFTVHTVALSENADTVLMDKLALGTDGMTEVAQSADDLMKIFLRIFDQAAPAEQVPFNGSSFLVDSSIEEFTALIFRNPGSDPTRLISPDKTEYRFDKEVDDVNWYKTDDYDLITLKRPLEGEWSVIADVDPDSRVTIVSNLNLLVKPLPSNLFTGQDSQLSVLFQEQKRTVTDADFLRLLRVDGAVDHTESGERWDKPLSADGPPDNGVYTTALDMFDEEGRYQVSVNVDGKSFQREFKHHITVRKPFAVDIDKQVDSGREQYLLTVRAYSQLIDPAQTTVVARIKDPDGRSSIKPLLRTPKDEWELLLEPDLEGRYQVRVRIDGEDVNGESFNFDPGLQEFQYPSDDNPFNVVEPEPAPVVVAEPEPEPVVEEPVVEEPEEVEAAAEEEPESEAEVEEESSSWQLYVALGAGNLLIVVLAFFAYRMVMGKGDSLKELEEVVAEAEAEPEPVKSEPEPAVEEPAGAVPEMQSIDEIEPIEDDFDEMPMDDGLDLSSDEVTEADIPVEDQDVEDLLAGLEEPEDSGDDVSSDVDDALGGFSLDDFAPDSLDEDADDETPKP